MTPVEFATHVRFMTRTSAATFTDAQILGLMKIRQDELAKDLVEVDEDILLSPRYADLAVNQREYAFPPDIVSSIKRVEAKFTSSGDYIKLKELDITSLRTAISNESLITQNFSNEDGGAYFDLSRKAVYIYSGTIVTVANGLRLWVNSFLAPITSLAGTTDMSVDPSDTTHGTPRELHEIWARGVIIDYKGSREQPIPLTEKELNYRIDKKAAFSSLKPQNRDRDSQLTVPYNDGSQY